MLLHDTPTLLPMQASMISMMFCRCSLARRSLRNRSPRSRRGFASLAFRRSQGRRLLRFAGSFARNARGLLRNRSQSLAAWLRFARLSPLADCGVCSASHARLQAVKNPAGFSRLAPRSKMLRILAAPLIGRRLRVADQIMWFDLWLVLWLWLWLCPSAMLISAMPHGGRFRLLRVVAFCRRVILRFVAPPRN